MIRLYSTHCPKCKVAEIKLSRSGLEYEIVDDKDAVVKAGEEHGIQSAPILEVDGEFMDFATAIRYLGEAK